MAQSQESLYVEIQHLKEALEASQKNVDRYGLLTEKLYEELDDLRNKICHACKKKLVPGNVSALSAPLPAVSAVSGTAPSVSAPLWRRIFQGLHHQPRSRSPINNLASGSSSKIPDFPSPIPSIASQAPTKPSSQKPTTITSNPKSEHPEWSVVYNSKVKQVLDLHVTHVFTYATSVYCAKISTDGRSVAIGLFDNGRTYINDVRTGSNIHVLEDLYIKDPLTIYSVQFSPDGQLLATASSDNQIRIWDIAKRHVRSMFKRHTGVINEIAFSPDGRFLVSACDDHSVRIWRIRDGSSKKLNDGGLYFEPVAFSPDGRYIAAGNVDSWLRIWDVRTHKLVARWKGCTNLVWCLEFTPDGKGLLSGSRDKTVKYWDVSSLGIHQGKSRREGVISSPTMPEILSFAGHAALDQSIAFFPGHSQWVFTGAADGSVQLWDSRTGVCQLTLVGHTNRVQALDFSRTEKCLVTASLDRHVTIWKYQIL